MPKNWIPGALAFKAEEAADVEVRRELERLDAELHEVARKLRTNGINVAFFLQFGYPGETWEDIEATLDLEPGAAVDDAPPLSRFGHVTGVAKLADGIGLSATLGGDAAHNIGILSRD